MDNRENIIAFLATLLAIVLLVGLGAFMAGQGKPTEALGIGGAVTGLIGVIGTFRPKAPLPENQDVTVTNPVSDPVPTITDKK